MKQTKQAIVEIIELGDKNFDYQIQFGGFNPPPRRHGEGFLTEQAAWNIASSVCRSLGYEPAKGMVEW